MSPRFEFVTELPDAAGFAAMILEYWQQMGAKLAQAGGAQPSPEEMVAETMVNIAAMTPPNGRLLLATSETGGLLGCGMIRHIRPDAAEFKRMYVRPQARGLGLGSQIFHHRLAEARRMGCTTIYADTVRGNRPMLAMYEKFGFTHIPRYPENANSVAMEPFLVYLKRDLV